MNRGESVLITAEIIRETDLAILIHHNGEEIWLPKSQIDYDGDVGDEADIEIPEWLADEKGIG